MSAAGSGSSTSVRSRRTVTWVAPAGPQRATSVARTRGVPEAPPAAAAGPGGRSGSLSASRGEVSSQTRSAASRSAVASRTCSAVGSAGRRAASQEGSRSAGSPESHRPGGSPSTPPSSSLPRAAARRCSTSSAASWTSRPAPAWDGPASTRTTVRPRAAVLRNSGAR